MVGLVKRRLRVNDGWRPKDHAGLGQNSLQESAGWELFRLRPVAGNEGDKMELRISHEEGYVLAKTIGNVDDTAKELFGELLHPLVGQSGTKVVLDLSQSKLINSNGIGQLVSVVTHANSSGSRVVLAACSQFVAEVLKRCKLNTFFEMADSVPDGIGRVLG